MKTNEEDFQKQLQLFQRAQTGDTRALGELIEPNRKPFATLVQRFFFGASGDLIEEMVDRCILRLMGNWQRWKQRNNACFSTFAYRVAINVLLHEKKRGHGRDMRARAMLNEQIAQSSTQGPEELVIERLDRRQKLKMLADVFQKLKKRDQRLVELRYTDPQLTYEEIAVEMGLSMKVIKGRLHRLHHRIRHLLKLEVGCEQRRRENKAYRQRRLKRKAIALAGS